MPTTCVSVNRAIKIQGRFMAEERLCSSVCSHFNDVQGDLEFSASRRRKAGVMGLKSMVLLAILCYGTNIRCTESPDAAAAVTMQQSTHL